MYLPDHFVETDPQAIDGLIAAHPLAQLIAQTPSGLVANPLPLLLVGGGLVGHLARANTMHQTVGQGAPVLALFSGPDAYISPNWYPTKAETHKAVPTWNYQQVQVHGTIHFSHLEADKRRAVSLLTSRMEGQTNGPSAWRMGDAPEDFLRDRLAEIVALRIDITRVLAKSKLSQNRRADDRASVADQVEARGNPALARAMRRKTD